MYRLACELLTRVSHNKNPYRYVHRSEYDVDKHCIVSEIINTSDIEDDSCFNDTYYNIVSDALYKLIVRLIEGIGVVKDYRYYACDCVITLYDQNNKTIRKGDRLYSVYDSEAASYKEEIGNCIGLAIDSFLSNVELSHNPMDGFFAPKDYYKIMASMLLKDKIIHDKKIRRKATICEGLLFDYTYRNISWRSDRSLYNAINKTLESTGHE